MARAIIFSCRLSPGDVLTMTAAVESLHTAYPGQFVTDVRTPAAEIWENNPRITRLEDGAGERLELSYATIHRSNQSPLPFLDGYTRDLGRQLGVALELTVNRPQLYLSDSEKQWINQSLWSACDLSPLWIGL